MQSVQGTTLPTFAKAPRPSRTFSFPSHNRPLHSDTSALAIATECGPRTSAPTYKEGEEVCIAKGWREKGPPHILGDLNGFSPLHSQDEHTHAGRIGTESTIHED